MLEQIGVLNLSTYLIGVFFIILLPGPNSLFVLKTSVSYGVRAGYQAALAVFIGDALLMFCAYIGVASVIRTTPVLFALMKYLGAIYLFYLGCRILYANFFQKKMADQEQPSMPEKNIFMKAFALSLTNPKAILFFMSFFVQFIDFDYAHTALPFAILALILELFSFVYLSVLILGGAVVARFFQRKKLLAKLSNGVVGVFFLGFAAKLARTSST